MTEASPYQVPLDDLEHGVRVPIAEQVEGQPDPAVPHDLPHEDAALGTPLKFYR